MPTFSRVTSWEVYFLTDQRVKFQLLRILMCWSKVHLAEESTEVHTQSLCIWHWPAFDSWPVLQACCTQGWCWPNRGRKSWSSIVVSETQSVRWPSATSWLSQRLSWRQLVSEICFTVGVFEISIFRMHQCNPLLWTKCFYIDSLLFYYLLLYFLHLLKMTAVDFPYSNIIIHFCFHNLFYTVFLLKQNT